MRTAPEHSKQRKDVSTPRLLCAERSQQADRLCSRSTAKLSHRGPRRRQKSRASLKRQCVLFVLARGLSGSPELPRCARCAQNSQTTCPPRKAVRACDCVVCTPRAFKSLYSARGSRCAGARAAEQRKGRANSPPRPRERDVQTHLRYTQRHLPPAAAACFAFVAMPLRSASASKPTTE